MQTNATPSTTSESTRALVRAILDGITDQFIDKLTPLFAPTPTALRTIQCPRIGAEWREQGGRYIGIAAGTDGQPDYHLIRGAYAPKKLNHENAIKFARDCRDGGFSDWDNLERTDGALIYANDRASMREGWHWLKPQSAHNGDAAWAQRMGHGDQYYDRKSNELEVVLVRRIPIQ